MGYDAEYSFVPSSVTTKTEFYEHVLNNLKALLEDSSDEKQNWVHALSSAGSHYAETRAEYSSVSSVLYNSFAEFKGFGLERRVNWAGFYMIPSLFPSSSRQEATNGEAPLLPSALTLGPYHGRPGCLRIPLSLKRKGVCANAFLSHKTVTVQDVHKVPGHIACDGTTESEIVVPVILSHRTAEGKELHIPIGVLDIDCQKADIWSEEDKEGLERIVSWLVVESGVVDWEGPLGLGGGR